MHEGSTPPDDETPSALLGRWRLVRADASLDFAPGARMEFQPGGRLLYTFEVGGRLATVPLVYRVEGDALRTDNPAAPHLAVTRFEFGPGDVLILDFAGARALFVRQL